MNTKNIQKNCNHCGNPISEILKALICNSCKAKEAINEALKLEGISYQVPENIKILSICRSEVSEQIAAQLLYLGRLMLPLWNINELGLINDSVHFLVTVKDNRYFITIDYDYGGDSYTLSFYNITINGQIKEEEINDLYFDDIVEHIDNFLTSKK